MEQAGGEDYSREWGRLFQRVGKTIPESGGVCTGKDSELSHEVQKNDLKWFSDKCKNFYLFV